MVEASNLVGLDIQVLSEKLKEIIDRSYNLIKKLVRILNFEFHEKIINIELESALKEAVRLDLRGDLIDTLLMMKELRD